jgi:hypothetical protein
MTMLGRLVLLSLALAVTASGALAGGGGPSPGAVTGWDGVVAPGGATRYVTLWAGDKTLVAAVRVNGGRVVRSRVLPGSYGVPLVANDGSAGGVSADGSTLVLATFAPAAISGATTEFAVLRASNFKVRRIVELPGSWSYDAISPDGSLLYLIQYLTVTNQPRYKVRAYDLAAGALLPGAIVDKREPGAMLGIPATRATNGLGGWAYTLYGKPSGEEHFVHALDTRNRAAVCIDLPWDVPVGAIMAVRMEVRPDGKLVLTQPGVGTLASVDTTSFKVAAYRKPVARG